MLTVVCCSFGPIVNGYDPPVKSVDPGKCYVVFAGERGKLLPVYLLCQLMQLLFLLQELEISQTFELLPVQHQPTRLLHIQGG